MARPAIRITLIDRLGKRGCHRGHRVGESFDFDTERGKLCPMAMHVFIRKRRNVYSIFMGYK